MKKILFSVLSVLLLASVSSGFAQYSTQPYQNTGQTILNTPGNVGTGIANGVNNGLQGIGGKVENAVGNIINGYGNQLLNGVGGNGQLPSGSFSLPDKEEFGKDIAQNTSARSYVLKVLNFVLSFLGLIAIIMVIYAGFIYLTQAEEGKDKAKGILLYAVVGILVVLVSFALVNTVITQAPVGGDDRSSAQVETFRSYALQDRGSPGAILDSVVDVYEKAPSGLFSQTTASLINSVAAEEVFIDRNNIASLIVIKADTFIDTDEAIYVSLEEAKKGLTFQFNARSEVDWDMGDGHSLSTTPGKTFSYAYGQPGVYAVTALGHDGRGDRILQVKAVVVGAQFAQIRASQTQAPTGREIEFDGNASDVQGIAGNVIRYTWNCSGGIGCFDSLDTPIFSTTFTVPGTYVITLEIETSTGLIDAVAQQVIITGGSPAAYFTGIPSDKSEKIGSYFFSARESSSSLGTKEGLSYIWTLNEEQITTDEPSLEYKFPELGTYEVELVVFEKRPGQELYSKPFQQTIEVKNILSVDFSIVEKDIFAGEEIHFIPKSDDALRYLWDFGDGETSREKLPKHTYKNPGEKVITLLVQSGEEKQKSERTIVVRNKYQATTFIKTLVNTNLVDTEQVVIRKSDRIDFSAKSLDKYGKVVPFNHTWYVNGRLVDPKDLNASMNDFGTYVVRLVSVHAKIPDQRAESTRKIWVRNQEPVIDSATISQGNGLPNGTVKMNVEATDPEGGDLTYIFKAFFQGEEEVAQSGTRPEKLLTLKNGVYTFLVEALDKEGDKATYKVPGSIRIAGVINNEPEVDFVIDPARYHFTTTDFSFESRATDVDDDILHYTWLIDGEVKQQGKEDSFRGVSFDRPGNYTIAIRVDDKRGGIVEASKNIVVKWDPNIKTEETNTAPEVNVCIKGGNTVEVGSAVSIYSNAIDKDKDPLTYAWNVEAKKLYAETKNIQHVFKKEGVVPVEIIVNDGLVKISEKIFVRVVKAGTPLPLSSESTCAELNSALTGLSQRLQTIFKIFPTPPKDSFLSQIGWGGFFTSLKTKNEEVSSLEKLHTLGLIGIPSSIDLETLLSPREDALLRLGEKVKGTSAEKRIQKEISLITSSPEQATRNYLRTLSVSSLEVKSSFQTKIGARLFLRSTVPINFEAPLLMKWNDGNGSDYYGQSVSLSYSKPGLYLASLLLSDGLTETQDWIIIQVEK